MPDRSAVQPYPIFCVQLVAYGAMYRRRRRARDQHKVDGSSIRGRYGRDEAGAVVDRAKMT